jgi:hypothetical protein
MFIAVASALKPSEYWHQMTALQTDSAACSPGEPFSLELQMIRTVKSTLQQAWRAGGRN